MKNTYIIGGLILLLAIAGGAVYLVTQNQQAEDTTQQTQNGGVTPQPQPSPTPEPSQENEPQSVLGKSVEGRDITAYHFGSGDKELLFVGGMHGGYSWNTALVAYELMDYLEANPNGIPANVKVTVIPVLNPDGLEKTVGTAERFTKANVPVSLEATIPGRFNANNVDLNRNFDCDWQSVGIWQSREVDGGASAFSEPESRAFRGYVQANNPAAVLVWFSAAGGVYASHCGNDPILPETTAITNAYAQASGYPAYEEFDFYEVTGDSVNWLAQEGTPAISVLLSNHTDTEWNKNRAGIEALFEYYAE